MRITFLLTQSLESPSGLGRYWPLSKELVRLGHQVTILSLHHDFSTLRQRSFVESGVTVCYVGQMHVRKVGNTKSYFNPSRLAWVTTIATLRLAQFALRAPTDVYHLGKPHPMNGLAALPLRYVMQRPVYLDCDDYEAESNRFSGDWQRRVVAWFEDHLPKIAAGITVNTRFTAERLNSLGYPDDRIVYVPNGVDRDIFCAVSEHEIEALCQRLGLPGYQVILYVGSMSLSGHAVNLLLDAFALVRQIESRAVLLLVGGGEDYELLKSQASSLGVSEFVRFIGRVPHAQIPMYYHLAAVSVDPILDDRVARARAPIKIVESLAMGTPVVTGNVGDRQQYLDGGKAGRLVLPGDARALATGILDVLENPSVALEMREAARSVRHRYYWDVLARDFVRVYDIAGKRALS